MVTKTLGVILFENATLLDFMGPLQFFDFLITAYREDLRIITISHQRGMLYSGKVPFFAEQSFHSMLPQEIDLLLIPGGPGQEKIATQEKEFLQFIKDAALHAEAVLSVCTGANILAATGLLEDKRATTNKRKYHVISCAHPQVKWVKEARWVVDGKFWTSSGVTAGMDMTFAFLKQHFGETKAREVSNIIEYTPMEDATKDPFVRFAQS